MRIVVFGAGGFVGGWICEELSTRNDFTLTACVRKWSSAVRLARRGLSISQADLESKDDIAALVSGADVVVNSAMPQPSREADLAVGLYLACAAAKVDRFIQFSSVAIYGERTGEVGEAVEATPTDDYGRGKAIMETRLLRAAEGISRPQLIILRPSLIYGPFSETWTVRYAKRIKKGRWRALGMFGEGTCNLVYAADVVRAVVAAATVKVADGAQVVNINGPNVVSWNEYIERFGDALGVTDRYIPSSLSFGAAAATAEILRSGGSWVKAQFKDALMSIYLSGGSAGTIMRDTDSFAKLYPSFDEIKLLRRKVRYTWNLGTDVFGFVPSVTLEEGLRHSAAWCRTHGVI